MKEIVNIRLEDSDTGESILLDITRTTNVDNDMILMSNSLFTDDKSYIPLIKLMDDSLPEFLKGYSNILENVVIVSPSESEIPNRNLAYQILNDGAKLLWVISKSNFNKLTLISSDEESEIQLNKVDITGYSGEIYNVTIIAISETEINNVSYIFHELVKNPHRNLKEAVLYESELLKYKELPVITDNGNLIDKRSGLFLAKELKIIG